MIIFGNTKWPDKFFPQGRDTKGIRVRVHPRSRSYRLSILASGEPVLTVPPKGKIKDATAFLAKQQHWLNVRLDRRLKAVPFCEGAFVPVRGIEHQLIGTGKIRGQVAVSDNNDIKQLHVPGGATHMARRLKDWLKKQALADLKTASAIHADRLGVSTGTISIRSQSTRWGSCSSSGSLSYNWRLILAPPHVLDYVAAHEVAHLCEMNHSAAFWAKVEQTLPDMDKGRNWLKVHGTHLMGYGEEAY